MRAPLAVWAVLATLVAAYLYHNVLVLEHEVNDLRYDVEYYKNMWKNVADHNAELYEQVRTLKGENAMLKNELIKKDFEFRERTEDVVSELETYKVIVGELLKIPKGYYEVGGFPWYEQEDEGLEDFLEDFKLPHPYEENVFDCSEIAAYTEWALENAHFDAYIVEGFVGDDRSTLHAWVMVKVGGETYYIDPLLADEPLEPDEINATIIHVYRDIYDAVIHDRSVMEWDWWNVVGFPPGVKR